VLRKHGDRSKIVVGDFNVVHTERDGCADLDSHLENGFTYEARCDLTDLLSKFELVDAFRYFYSNECWGEHNRSHLNCVGTACGSNGTKRSTSDEDRRGRANRLDYVLISEDLVRDSRIVEMEHLGAHWGLSDHCPIRMRVRLRRGAA
jgi:exonuclease III